ncbi:unnamed protein product, partial [Polarella glacialis]
PGGISISTGVPTRDFAMTERRGWYPARNKVVKYQLTELEDNLECKAKTIPDDERRGETIIHRWWRVLKELPPQGGDALAA